MANEKQDSNQAPLSSPPTRGEKWKARLYHMAKGIDDNLGAIAYTALTVGALTVGAVGVAVGVAVAVGAVLGAGLAAIFVISSTKKHADKISEPAKKTWRKLGVAFLAAVSFTTGAAVGKTAYDGFNAQEAERQKAEAAELAAPRAKYTLECSLTVKAAQPFKNAVQNGGVVTIPKGCKLSLQP